MSHPNGTVMVKYFKIKSGSKGVKACINYITNPEKTIEKIYEPPEELALANLDRLLSYVKDGAKTFDSAGKQYISGLNCCSDLALSEFELSEKLYHLSHNERLNDGHKANQAYHIIISYKGTDLSPQQVHDLGIEFAKEFCKDEYQAIITTHLNTDNYHNHILVNAYSIDGSHKLHDQKNMYKNLRFIADSISNAHSLPINENGQRYHPVNYKEWAAKEAYSESVSKALRSGNLEQFLMDKNNEKMVTIGHLLRNRYPDSSFYYIDSFGQVIVNDYDMFGRERLLLEKLFLYIIAFIKEDIFNGMFNSKETIKAYELAQESIEVIKRYEIEGFDEIDDKLRYYHSMKGAGQKEEHTANTDSEYSAAMRKIAESTEAIRALYKLQKDIERSETVLTATLSFLEKYKEENADVKSQKTHLEERNNSHGR